MKKLSTLLIVLILVGSLCSCSSGNANSEYYEEQIATLEKQIEDLQAQLRAYEATGIDPVDNSGEKPATGVEVPLTLGETVTIDNVVEFTLNGCSWENQVLPSNTSGSYSYYDDEADETFLVIRGTMTNLCGDSYDIGNIQESNILINGKYSFNVRMVAEDTDGAGFGNSTKPLQTVNLIIYSSISDGVKDIFENATITLNILNDPSRVSYFFDEEDECKNTYVINIASSELT